MLLYATNPCLLGAPGSSWERLISLRRLDARTILDIARKRAKEAWVKHLTPHDFRRTMTSDLLEVVDISTVSARQGTPTSQLQFATTGVGRLPGSVLTRCSTTPAAANKRAECFFC
jgi:hypothetical protein